MNTWRRSWLRREDLGRLEPGTPAGVCILDDAFRVTRTLVGGAESFVADTPL